MIDDSSGSHVKLPNQWIEINKDFLTRKRGEALTRQEAITYFDGKVPTWKEALAPTIPRRVIVNNLVSKLDASRRRGESRVTLLTGGGGEGKSTALRQVTCLLAEQPDWRVIWRNRLAGDLTTDFLLKFPRGGQTWLIVSDDDQVIADRVFEAVVALREENRQDIQFLLACQDVDWRWSGAHRWAWEDYTDVFEPVRLKGLDEADAEEILKAWRHYGDEGLGRLARFSNDLPTAVNQLLRAAELEERELGDEGSFLGAMLRERIGAGLRGHVKDILARLKRKELSTGGLNLLTAFTYIAVMHAEAFTFLTKEVLAKALDCSPLTLDSEIIPPLREETAANAASKRLLTRHILIARTATQLLADDGHKPVHYYERLLRAAHQLYAAKTEGGKKKIPAYNDWRFLPDKLFILGQQNILKAQKLEGGEQEHQKRLGIEQRDSGIHLAEMINSLSPDDPRLINQLGKILRSNNEAEKSVQLFRTAPTQAQWHRSFFSEWAMSEWAVGSWELKAILTGIALADDVKMEALIPKRAKHGLAALALAFGHLYANYGNDRVFLEACGAAAQLGRMMPSDESTHKSEDDLITYEKFSRRAGVSRIDDTTALNRLRAGIVSAWEKSEGKPVELDERINKLSYDELGRLLNIIPTHSPSKVIKLVKRGETSNEILSEHPPLVLEPDEGKQERH